MTKYGGLLNRLGAADSHAQGSKTSGFLISLNLNKCIMIGYRIRGNGDIYPAQENVAQETKGERAEDTN